MMKEWISIFDDMPLKEKGYKHLSVDVRCQTANGREFIGCYHEEDAEWYELKKNGSGFKKVREEVTAWQTLE